MGSLLGQHRDDARLAAAGAVLFAASYLLMHAFGPDFDHFAFGLGRLLEGFETLVRQRAEE